MKNMVCDICGIPAVTSAKFESDTTTPLKFDLCQNHAGILKRIMHAFTKQEPKEIEIVDDEVVLVDKDVK